MRSFFGWMSTNLVVLAAVAFLGFSLNSAGNWFFEDQISTWAVPGAGPYSEMIPRSIRVRVAPNGKAFSDGEKQIPSTHHESPEFHREGRGMEG